MSTLSELIPSGGTQNNIEFVAQGTLANGQTVALRSDGKVEAVAQTAGSTGTETEFENGPITSSSCCYDTGQDKILIFYADQNNNNYMTMVVGTMTSGNSISFGTPVVALSETSNYCMAVFDPSSGKSLVGGQATSSSYTGAFFAVTISGTTPSVGAKASLFTGLQYTCGVYNTTAQKILVAGNENGNSNYAAAAVATISGTSVSFGSKIVWNSQDSRELKIAYDSVNNNNVCVFKKQANSWGQFGILVVSGTSVSVISTHTFAQTSTRYPAIAYDVDKAKMLIAYQNDSSSYHLWYACVTLSGNSPTTGTAAVLLAATGGYTSYALQLIYHPTLKKIIVNYGGQYSQAGTYAEVAISGTTATLGTPVAYTSSTNNGYYYASLAYNPDQDNILAAYMSESKGESTAFSFISTNASSFIGITNAAISSSATGEVAVKGGLSTGGNVLPYSLSFGSSAVFESTTAGYTATAYDSNNNKIVVGYSDSQGYGAVSIGTVSGSAISYATPVRYTAQGGTSYNTVVYDPTNQKVVAIYADSNNSNHGYAVVGTVSGTTTSWGSPVVFTANNSRYYSAAFDSNAGKIVIAYQNQANTYGQAIVGTVSGTSISFGTAVTFEAASARYVNIGFDSNVNKVVIAYRDDGNSGYGTSIVGTVSGTSISFGSAVIFESAESSDYNVVFDSNANKVVIAYSDVGNAYKGTAIVGTVSGTSISFGSASIFNSGTISTGISASFDSAQNKVIVGYLISSDGEAVVGTVSGTSISFDTPVEFSDGTLTYVSSVYDANSSATVFNYMDSTGSNDGTGIVGSLANALTIGSNYFVQDDGTLATTSSSNKAGKAISTTALNLVDPT